MMKFVYGLAFLLALSGAKLNAQYYNRSSPVGLDRSIGGQQMTPPPEKEKKPSDYLEESMTRMTSELTLDAFQAAVIKGYMKDYIDFATNVNAENIPNDGKMEKIKAAQEKMDKKILEVLSQDQGVKYLDMKNKKKKDKEKDKKKKKRERDDSPSDTLSIH
jgi:hypothetical protein